MKTFNFSHLGDTIKGYLIFDSYQKNPNNIAVVLMGWNEDQYWENYSSLSINVAPMNPGEFVLNHDCTEIMQSLVSQGLFELTGKTINYGYVRNQPVYRILEKANDYCAVDSSGEYRQSMND